MQYSAVQGMTLQDRATRGKARQGKGCKGRAWQQGQKGQGREVQRSVAGTVKGRRWWREEARMG